MDKPSFSAVCRAVSFSAVGIRRFKDPFLHAWPPRADSASISSILPTTIGQKLLAHFRQVALLETDLHNKLQGRNLKEEPFPIAVAVNTESLSTWFVEAIGPVVKNGEMIVEILIDDQDLTINHLRSGKAWGCVTSCAKPPFGCTSTLLGEMIYHCVATPDFKSRYFPRGINGKLLLKAPAAIYGRTDYMHRNYLRKHFRSYGEGNPTIHYVPSPQGIVAFAVEGMAYALLPQVSIKDHLDKGRLVQLMPNKPYKLPLYWQTHGLQTDLTLRVSKTIISHASKALRC